MRRLTSYNQESQSYTVELPDIVPIKEGYGGDAIEKLANYENLRERIEEEQKQISQELDKLRSQGKSKSVKFREGMSKKLMNSYVLSIFQANDL